MSSPIKAGKRQKLLEIAMCEYLRLVSFNLKAQKKTREWLLEKMNQRMEQVEGRTMSLDSLNEMFRKCVPPRRSTCALIDEVLGMNPLPYEYYVTTKAGKKHEPK